MKNSFYLILLILFSSCSSGKYYANYRAGGKSKKIQRIHVDETPVQKTNEMLSIATELEQIENNDPFLLATEIRDEKKIISHPIYPSTNCSPPNTTSLHNDSSTEKKQIEIKTSTNKSKVNSKNKLSPFKGRSFNWFAIILSLSIGLNVFFLTGGIWLAIGISLATIAIVYLIGYILVLRFINGLFNVVDDIIQTSKENGRRSRRSLHSTNSTTDFNNDFIMDEALAQAFVSPLFNFLAAFFGLLSFSAPTAIWFSATCYLASVFCLPVGVISILIALSRYLKGTIDERNKKYMWLWLLLFIVSSILAVNVYLLIFL